MYQSDQRRAPGQLSRQGPPALRWALYEAASRAPTRQPDRDYYLQAAERLGHNRACLAVARKLLKRSYHTLPRARRRGAPARMTFPVRAGPHSPRCAAAGSRSPAAATPAWTARKDRAAATLPPAGSIAVGTPLPTPPAQIPACASNALGSSLGFWRRSARRARGEGCGVRVAIERRGVGPLPGDLALSGCGAERRSPVPDDPSSERAERRAVVGHRVVVVVPGQDAGEPASLFGDRVMHPPRISVLTACSLARIFFLLVTRLSLNRPRLSFPQMCVKPRKSNVSGLESPRLLSSRAANRPNSISRVFPACSSKPNFANLSRRSARNRSASSRCSKPAT